MSNICVFRLVVSGMGVGAIRDVFDRNLKPTRFGSVWKAEDEVIRFSAKHGDGVFLRGETLIVEAEATVIPPLKLIEAISRQYPDLAFDLAGTELTNMRSQRWCFKFGRGRLLDCIQEADRDEPQVFYRLNGRQLLPLPHWASEVVGDLPSQQRLPSPNQ